MPTTPLKTARRWTAASSTEPWATRSRDDWRVFEHNTLPMVRAMRRALEKANLLKKGAPVVATHLARTLHPSQAALEAHEAASDAPLLIARDGMMFEF